MSGAPTLMMPVDRLTRAQQAVFSIWAVLLVLAIFPFTEDPVGPIKEWISACAVVVAGALALWQGAIAGRPLRLKSPLLILLLLWLLTLAVAAVFSASPAQSLHALRRWAVLVLLALYAAQIFRTPAAAARLFLVIVLAVAAASLYGMAQHLGFDPFPWADRTREEYRGLPATFGNPNFAGHALVLALILGSGLCLQRGKRWLLAPVLLMLAHLYLTHMRGGPLALGAAAVVVLVAWFTIRRYQRFRPHLILLLSLAIGAGAFAGALGLHQGFRGTWLPLDSSLALRYAAYYSAASMVLDRPLTGYGPEGYVRESPQYWTDHEALWYAEKGEKNPYVHNELLEAAVEAGGPGAFLYLLLLAYALLASLHLASTTPEARRTGLLLAGAFTAVFVDGLFGFNLHVPVSAGLFFVLLGVLEGLTARAGVTRPARLLLVLLLLLASVCLALQTRLLIADFRYQQAQAVVRYLQENPGIEPVSRDQLLHHAYQRLELAQALVPWDARFPYALGRLAQEREQFELAIHHAAATLRLQPFAPPYLMQAARAHMNRAAALAASQDAAAAPGIFEELDAAEAQAEKVLALCGYLSDAEELLGRAAALRALHTPENDGRAPGIWRRALTHFDRALELKSSQAVGILLLKAQAHMNVDEPEAAAATLRRAMDVAPREPQIWPLWDRLRNTGLPDNVYLEALNHALELLARQPDPPREALAEVQHRLGAHALDTLGDASLARIYHREAVVNTPHRLERWGGYLRTAPMLTRLEAAEDLMHEVLAAHPGYAPPAQLAPLRDLDAATPEDLAAWAQQIAATAWNLRQHAEPAAVDHQVGWLAGLVLQALERIPVPGAIRGEVLTFAGATLYEAGRWAEADETLMRAVPMLDARAQSLPVLLRSRAQHALGQRNVALGLAREAARLAPNNYEARHHLARLLTEDGAHAQANLEYLALLSQIPRNNPLRAVIEQEHAALQEHLAESAAGSQAPES